ncbi:hypothetical protein [Microbulbifer sp. ZKSA002]|uniref:hypothetical protein n=1 Tax=Microbulbifer sp. ZKSA002 TaxID=3243388 RepID=UPI004039127C
MKKLLLIDTDIVAYKACAKAEFECDFGDWTFLATNFEVALNNAVERIESIRERLKADEVVLCLTDDHNWRKDVLPTYKRNRIGTRKPMKLPEVKAALCEQYESFLRPGLEADDVMGILATHAGYKPKFKKIIVSEDKDLRTIPALVFNPDKDTKPRLITEDEADRWHMAQSIAGDVTDGYTGCPGMGLSGAEELIAEPYQWEQYEHTFKSGPRKGKTEERWRKIPCEDLWEGVVSCYAKQGLTEEYALSQAQVARILRASDYDFDNKKVILWEPINEH